MPAERLPPETRFDVLTDVHGCLDEFGDLLERMGYGRPKRPDRDPWQVPEGRHLVIAGDIVDRGPGIAGLLRVAMAMVKAGTMSVTIGNHDDKVLRALRGRPVKVSQGLEASLAQLQQESGGFRRKVIDFIASMPSHLVLDEGRLVVAHAGLPEEMHGNTGGRVREVAMYGLTQPGEDEWGLPLRIDWAASYSGPATVVYGHTPVVEPVWVNNTIDIDTGCVFGHRLTALRYPERELVSVSARGVYQEKGGPFRVRGPGGEPVRWMPAAQAG
jgi:protein phosphatase